MPKEKVGRKEFAKYFQVFADNNRKHWHDIRENINVIQMLKNARSKLGYSDKTGDCDLFYSLRRASIKI